VGFVVILGRLYWLQVVAGDRFSLLAAGQRSQRLVLPPQRGSIFAADGSELAISMEMKTIYANPHFVADPKAAAAALAPILNLDPAELEGKLSKDAGFQYLARKVSAETAGRVKALALPGVDILPESKRLYPAGQLASQVLGFVGFDNQGLGGLEQRYDSLLTGSPGEALTERDPQGREIPVGKTYVKPSSPGSDLILTIDREIQFEAESALAKAINAYQAKGGSVVVMNPRNGEILAMANLPTFDPNNVKDAAPEALRNRAVSDSYEPGSPSKVITAASAIESQVVKPDDEISVPYQLRLGTNVIHDSHVHPVQTMSFAQVIQQSSNVGTIKVALQLGKSTLYDYLLSFGYGKKTALNFPGEARGILPKPDHWWGSAVGTIPIGQGVSTTTLQMMDVFQTLANGGVSLPPKVLKTVVDSGGRRRSEPSAQPRRVVSDQTAASVTNMLIGVTEGEEGTGQAAAIPGYQVAGKTGTAQKALPDGQGYAGYMASFFGYAPAADPKLLIGVVLDEPTPIYGGKTSAVTFGQVMQFSLRRLGIGPGPVLLTEGTPLPAPARSQGVATDSSSAPNPRR